MENSSSLRIALQAAPRRREKKRSERAAHCGERQKPQTEQQHRARLGNRRTRRAVLERDRAELVPGQRRGGPAGGAAEVLVERVGLGRGADDVLHAAVLVEYNPDQSELRRTSVAADQFLVITPPETVTPTPTPLGGSPVPTPSAEVTAAGDANCDGLITAADLTALVSLIATPQTLWCGADVNQDEKLDSGDVTALISTLFESL